MNVKEKLSSPATIGLDVGQVKELNPVSADLQQGRRKVRHLAHGKSGRSGKVGTLSFLQPSATDAR